MEFRELTLQRLKKFVDQRFFSVFDYLEGVLRVAGAMKDTPPARACSIFDNGSFTNADPLRFMAGLETLAAVDYSLCIKAGVHFTLCGGAYLIIPASAPQ